METLRIRSEADIPAAADILRRGGLVAVPTETVYGLCCSGLDELAVDALYEIKGRPEQKPLSLMVAGPEAMATLCSETPPAAAVLAARFWPGPLTLVLPASEAVPAIVRAGGPTVGLRCPDHPLALELLRQCALPLAGPSANPSGLPSPKSAEEVLSYFDGRIGAVIDGGVCGVGRESTVLDLSSIPYRVLRQGALPEEAIRAALRQSMTVVGVTGGTGSGKSGVLRELERRGALILDCDEIYHRLTRESGELRRELTERFGDVYNGAELDRKKLGAVVFADPAELSDLNAITHRYVTREVERLLTDRAMEGGILAGVEAIALIESGIADRCTFTVVVTAPREVRLKRIMERDGLTADYAAARIAAQHDDEFYRSRCTHTLENGGTMEEFQARCRQFFDAVL